MSQFVWTFPGGKPLDNFETLGAVSEKVWTVPPGKLWLIYGGHAERDASATFQVILYTSADKIIMKFHYVSAGTSAVEWPSGTTFPFHGPWPAKAGDKLKYEWGAAQTTPEISLLILEIDAP